MILSSTESVGLRLDTVDAPLGLGLGLLSASLNWTCWTWAVWNGVLLLDGLRCFVFRFLEASMDFGEDGGGKNRNWSIVMRE